MSKDVISFKDFLRNQSVSLSKPIDIIEDNHFIEDLEKEVEIEEDEHLFENKEDINHFDNEDEYDVEESPFDNVKIEQNEEITPESKEFYKLYQDINENFICDIHIDGVDAHKVLPRLVIESENLSIMYKGIVEDGKCIIPVNKLDFLSEGQIGKIKLEVVADNTIFIPWEDSYKIFKKVKTIIK